MYSFLSILVILDQWTVSNNAEESACNKLSCCISLFELLFLKCVLVPLKEYLVLLKRVLKIGKSYKSRLVFPQVLQLTELPFVYLIWFSQYSGVQWCVRLTGSWVVEPGLESDALHSFSMLLHYFCFKFFIQNFMVSRHFFKRRKNNYHQILYWPK